MPVVCSRLGAGGLGAYSSKGIGENCPGSSPDLDPTSSWFLLLLLRRGTTASTQHSCGVHANVQEESHWIRSSPCSSMTSL